MISYFYFTVVNHSWYMYNQFYMVLQIYNVRTQIPYHQVIVVMNDETLKVFDNTCINLFSIITNICYRYMNLRSNSKICTASLTNFGMLYLVLLLFEVWRCIMWYLTFSFKQPTEFTKLTSMELENALPTPYVNFHDLRSTTWTNKLGSPK